MEDIENSIWSEYQTRDQMQGCYMSREICLFPRQREILGNTGKYKISNNGLLVGSCSGRAYMLEVDQIR